MPVEQADRDHLAWLIQEDQKVTWRIRLPLGTTLPVQPAPVNVAVVNAAADDPMGSDGDDYVPTASGEGPEEDSSLDSQEDLQEDEQLDANMQLDDVIEADEYHLLPDWNEHRFAKPGSADAVAAGSVQFAGGYWPVQQAMRPEISAAYTEAQAMIASGLAQAEAALGGDPAAVQLMTHWFGAREAVIPAGEDWWLGVRIILSKLRGYRGRDLYVYLNGTEQEDEQQDWPRAGAYENVAIDDDDIKGYASSVEKADDMVVVFHCLYCDSNNLLVGTQPAYTNAASVIVHELTHNLGGTKDHAAYGHLVYDFRVAWGFGQVNPAQAWYNACNIEYFCVEAHYGDVNGARAGFIQALMNSNL